MSLEKRVVSKSQAGTIWEIRNQARVVTLLLEIRDDLPGSIPERYLAAANAFAELMSEAHKIYALRQFSFFELGTSAADGCNPVTRFVLVRATL